MYIFIHKSAEIDVEAQDADKRGEHPAQKLGLQAEPPVPDRRLHRAEWSKIQVWIDRSFVRRQVLQCGARCGANSRTVVAADRAKRG